MTAYYDDTPATSSRLFFIVLLLAALTVGTIALISYNQHAVERHGDAAWEVRYCMETQGPIETWNNPQTGRDAHIVCTQEGYFGIQVEEDGQEVTSFLKEKMKQLGQVRRYLSNRGYTQ